MKIATVIYKSPIGKWVNRTIPVWLKSVKKFYDEKDIVFITDNANDWKDTSLNLIEGKPFEYTPDTFKQHVVKSNFLRMQAYRLIQEPVVFLDLDCLLQAELPDWNDDVFRVLSQRKGANKRYKIGNEIIEHYCAAVQYQGSDHFDQWEECFEITRREPVFRDFRGIGEAAMCLMIHSMKNVEVLPITYGWPAWKYPYPKGTKVLHYSNRDGKRLLLETRNN